MREGFGRHVLIGRHRNGGVLGSLVRSPQRSGKPTALTRRSRSRLAAGGSGRQPPVILSECEVSSHEQIFHFIQDDEAGVQDGQGYYARELGLPFLEPGEPGFVVSARCLQHRMEVACKAPTHARDHLNA